MNERIKQLRKKFNMTQEEFSSKIKLSRNFITQIETGAKSPSDRTISDICREFNVNEEWLRTGEGSMTIESGTFSLDDFLKQHSATELELQIIKSYFDLEPDMRKMLIEHFQKAFSSTILEDKKEKTIAESEEEYKKNVLNSALKKESTALNTTAVEKII